MKKLPFLLGMLLVTLVTYAGHAPKYLNMFSINGAFYKKTTLYQQWDYLYKNEALLDKEIVTIALSHRAYLQSLKDEFQSKRVDFFKDMESVWEEQIRFMTVFADYGATHFDLAKINNALNFGDYSPAVTFLTAITHDKTGKYTDLQKSEAHYELAHIDFEEYRLIDAANHYAKAGELNKNNITAKLQMSFLHWKTGYPSIAHIFYHKALKLAEENQATSHSKDLYHAYEALAYFYYIEKHNEEAVEFYLKAAKLGEEQQIGLNLIDLGNIYHYLALLYDDRLEQFDKAEGFYKKSIAVYEANLPKTLSSLKTATKNYALFLKQQGR